MAQTNLLEAPANVELEVIGINAGPWAKRRLISMGIHAGDKLIRYNGSWGPILIKNITTDSTKIAIGRGLAQKIIVGQDTERHAEQ